MTKIAAFLALAIGSMSVLAGAKAIGGWNPGYKVLGWLPIYNLVLGVLTVAIPTILLWRGSPHAMISVVAFLSIHIAVTLLLLTAFHSSIARESILAMIFRVIVWLIILGLTYFSASKI